jgi:hypothetical protein
MEWLSARKPSAELRLPGLGVGIVELSVRKDRKIWVRKSEEYVCGTKLKGTYSVHGHCRTPRICFTSDMHFPYTRTLPDS